MNTWLTLAGMKDTAQKKPKNQRHATYNDIKQKVGAKPVGEWFWTEEIVGTERSAMDHGRSILRRLVDEGVLVSEVRLANGRNRAYFSRKG
jgi:hypothetical protein